jgi:DNA-directed RNA polymerase subunit RPC12/RpoP
MAYECPQCHEAAVDYVGTTDDAKTELRCTLCDHEWLHGGAARAVTAGKKVASLAEARERFPHPRRRAGRSSGALRAAEGAVPGGPAGAAP